MAVVENIINNSTTLEEPVGICNHCIFIALFLCIFLFTLTIGALRVKWQKST